MILELVIVAGLSFAVGFYFGQLYKKEKDDDFPGGSGTAY